MSFPVPEVDLEWASQQDLPTLKLKKPYAASASPMGAHVRNRGSMPGAEPARDLVATSLDPILRALCLQPAPLNAATLQGPGWSGKTSRGPIAHAWRSGCALTHSSAGAPVSSSTNGLNQQLLHSVPARDSCPAGRRPMSELQLWEVPCPECSLNPSWPISEACLLGEAPGHGHKGEEKLLSAVGMALPFPATGEQSLPGCSSRPVRPWGGQVGSTGSWWEGPVPEEGRRALQQGGW